MGTGTAAQLGAAQEPHWEGGGGDGRVGCRRSSGRQGPEMSGLDGWLFFLVVRGGDEGPRREPVGLSDCNAE